MQDAKPDGQVKVNSYALGNEVVKEDLELTVQHNGQWVQGEAIHRGQIPEC